jgi:hypothetical protein
MINKTTFAKYLIFTCLLTLCAPHAHAEDTCMQGNTRKQVIMRFGHQDLQNSADFFKALYTAERADANSPLATMSPKLELYFNANYLEGSDIVKANKITEHFDYEHFIPVLRRYADVSEFDDATLKANLNAGGIFHAPGIIIDGYIQKLNALAADLSAEEERTRQAIFEYMETKACRQIIQLP